jgi:exoribonuclease R
VGFDRIRAELELPARFPEQVVAEAERAVAAGSGGDRTDATDLPLVTIDPPGAEDLDQALAVSRRDTGFVVHYAIADLGAFVAPGGPLDTEARGRGQTLYVPDGKVPLHPPVLSEGAASLLPDQVRPAALWTLTCDEDGELTSAQVRRALVRSRARLDYAGVSADLAAGRPHPSLEALPAIGRLRRERALARGAIELALPDQEIEPDGRGGWRLVLRPRLDVEAWNAEMSLLTGMAAARMMLDAGIGVLRTLPDAGDGALRRLRDSAAALGIDWPSEVGPAELLSRLDPTRPEAMALFMDATQLLRGAAYTVFDGAPPALATHAGLAARYAHVTAPLRRLVDRFGTEICLALCADRPVPDWVRAALPELPALMSTSDAVAARVNRACLDQVEAWLLAGRVGAEFDAIVLRAGDASAEVLLTDPPVMAKCAGEGLPEGSRVRVRLVEADAEARTVAFERADGGVR